MFDRQRRNPVAIPRKISARFHFNCNTMQCDVSRACLLREFSSASRSLQYIVVRSFFVYVFLLVLLVLSSSTSIYCIRYLINHSRAGWCTLPKGLLVCFIFLA